LVVPRARWNTSTRSPHTATERLAIITALRRVTTSSPPCRNARAVHADPLTRTSRRSQPGPANLQPTTHARGRRSPRITTPIQLCCYICAALSCRAPPKSPCAHAPRAPQPMHAPPRPLSLATRNARLTERRHSLAAARSRLRLRGTKGTAAPRAAVGPACLAVPWQACPGADSLARLTRSTHSRWAWPPLRCGRRRSTPSTLAPVRTAAASSSRAALSARSSAVGRLKMNQ